MGRMTHGILVSTTRNSAHIFHSHLKQLKAGSPWTQCAESDFILALKEFKGVFRIGGPKELSEWQD
jgi:hypothetical protein